jgi:hypothetical protein
MELRLLIAYSSDCPPKILRKFIPDKNIIARHEIGTDLTKAVRVFSPTTLWSHLSKII